MRVGAHNQPLGLTARYALTYVSQRVPGTQVAFVQYTRVGEFFYIRAPTYIEGGPCNVESVDSL